MDLIQAICTHLEKSSTDASYTESQRESFETAFECLQSVMDESDGPAPTKEHELSKVWEQVVKPTKAKAKPAMSWDEFVDHIMKKGFFKNTSVGGRDYCERLEKAMKKYKLKFANADVPSLKKDLSAENKKRAEALKAEGNDLLKKQDLNGALKKYTSAVMIDNTNAIYFANRSVCQVKLGNTESAILDAKEATEINPKYIKGWNRLGSAYKSAGDNDQAIEAFQTVIDMSPPGSTNAQYCQKQIQDLQGAANPPASMPGTIFLFTKEPQLTSGKILAFERTSFFV